MATPPPFGARADRLSRSVVAAALVLGGCVMPQHLGIATGVNATMAAIAVTTVVASDKPDDSGPVIRTAGAALLVGALFAELVSYVLHVPPTAPPTAPP